MFLVKEKDIDELIDVLERQDIFMSIMDVKDLDKQQKEFEYQMQVDRKLFGRRIVGWSNQITIV